MRRSKVKATRRRLIPLLKQLALWNGAAVLTLGTAIAVHKGVFQHMVSGSWRGAVTTTQFLGWNAQNLIIEGRKTLSQKDIQDAIQFKVQEPLLSVEVEQIYCRLKKNPWIKKVCVKKIYPQTLYIRIEERKPYCCVLQKNRNVVVDHEGVILHEGLENHLPKVKGPDAHLHAHEILDVLAQFPKIMPSIDYLERKRSGRFDLFLKDGTRIALPQIGLTEALSKLSNIVDRKMAFNTHAVIDLRVPDKVIYTGKKVENNVPASTV